MTTDLVLGKDSAEKFERILGTLRSYAGNQSLGVDEDTFEAEMRTADWNRATGYLMRSQGMISGDVEGILALYLRQCSVQVTCRDLAVMAATLANGGVNPLTGERALPLRHVREVLSVMHTCGMYDAAGQWAFDIGVPAKSGVSGGILAVVPDKGGIGVYSPGLDAHGNSVRGIGVCQEISERLGLHVFAAEAEDDGVDPLLLHLLVDVAEPVEDVGAGEARGNAPVHVPDTLHGVVLPKRAEHRPARRDHERVARDPEPHRVIRGEGDLLRLLRVRGWRLAGLHHYRIELTAAPTLS